MMTKPNNARGHIATINTLTLTVSPHKPSRQDSIVLLYNHMNSWRVHMYLAGILTPVTNILAHSIITPYHSQLLCYDGPWSSSYAIASQHSKHVPMYPGHHSPSKHTAQYNKSLTEQPTKIFPSELMASARICPIGNVVVSAGFSLYL